MRYFVTGGTGLTGSNIALALQDRGDEVTITAYEGEQTLPDFKGRRTYPGLSGLNWEELEGVDVLFHQAAITGARHVIDRDEVIRSNFEASKILFEEAIQRGCKRIVYASSTAVYGTTPAPHHEDGPFDLNTPYAESKKMLDDYAIELARERPDLTIVGLRYCNVYGPHENHKRQRATMIYQFAQKMLSGNPQVFEHGEQKRDYIYVKDVVRANLLAAEAPASCVVNCGGGESTSFNDLISLLNETLGVERTPEYIPNPYVGNYQEHTQCDMTRAKEKIGFVPEYNIRKGIEDYYKSGFLV